jgi:predicted CopG family antitoxin
MTERITISVPDELGDRLKKLKGKLKISKICQKTLDKAAMLEEIKGSEDLEALKKRIQKEREQLFEPYYNEGFKDGTKAAYSFSYKKFQDFLFNLNHDDPGAAVEFSYHDETDKKICAIQSGELLLGEIKDHYGEGPEEYELSGAEVSFNKGWEDGVEYIWNQVKEALTI